MTPGPSFSVASTPTSAPVESDHAASSTSTRGPDSEQLRPIDSVNEPTISDSLHNNSLQSSNSDGMRRHDPNIAQPKHCSHCGQLLDALPLSLDRQPGLSRTPSSASLSGPSPSSYAFAPDYIRSQNRLQPHQSLTSAINAAAAVALSRHLGPEETVPTDADGHAICIQCAAQLADPAASTARASAITVATHTIDGQQPRTNVPGGSSTQAHAGLISDSSSSQQNSDAPQAHLTISVDNMGAGGDAVLTQSAEDVLMHDSSSFPPLDRIPITPALRAPSSPSGVNRSTSRGRLRFADVSSSPSSNAGDHAFLGEAASSSAALLGRSGSFSRSLSYNVSESVSSSSAPVVVSFPSSVAATPASEIPALLSPQETHFVAPSASLLARSSNSQSRTSSSGNIHGIASSPDTSSHALASASASPSAVKERRPSSARRSSRSGSSTAPTIMAFAAVGAASTTTSTAAMTKDDDPYGPAAVTRPRLSQIPRHVIADEIYDSARQTRPAHLISSSTSTSLAASSAQHAAGVDPTRAVRYHLDPLSYSSSDPALANDSGADGKERQDESVGMDVDDDKIPHGRTAAWGNVRWFDPYKPDPLAELSLLRNPPKGRGCLYPGATFNGTQKSGRNSYDVTVRIVNVDLEASHLCGYLNIRGLTEDWPELTTYFDAEIIGDRYGFVTGKWGATEADDLKHWARFPPFRPLRSALSKPGLRFNHLNKPFVFMRWKEKFLVPDHRVRDINGASFAGFYYVCVELGESAGRESRGRSDSGMSMGSSATGGHGTSPAGSPTLSSATTTGGPAVSGPQWYAARTQRRRELSLSAPSTSFQPAPATSDYHPHSPQAPSGPGFWPASPTIPLSSAGEHDPFASMWPADKDDYDHMGAAGKMSGFYFHENSEPYQQLSLRHTAERCSSTFEMR